MRCFYLLICVNDTHMDTLLSYNPSLPLFGGAVLVHWRNVVTHNCGVFVHSLFTSCEITSLYNDLITEACGVLRKRLRWDLWVILSSKIMS